MWCLATWSCTWPLEYTVLWLSTTGFVFGGSIFQTLKKKNTKVLLCCFCFPPFFELLVTFWCSDYSPLLHILITTTGDPQIFQLARRVLLKLSKLLVFIILCRWFNNALGRNTNDVAPIMINISKSTSIEDSHGTKSTHV